MDLQGVQSCLEVVSQVQRFLDLKSFDEQLKLVLMMWIDLLQKLTGIHETGHQIGIEIEIEIEITGLGWNGMAELIQG